MPHEAATDKWRIPPPALSAGGGVRGCFNAFVARNDPDRMIGHEYSFHQFAQLCGRPQPDNDTLHVARYLVSLGILDVFYLLADTRGNFSEKYSAREVLEAEKLGSLVHPQTGEELTEFKSNLYPFLVFCRSAALPV